MTTWSTNAEDDDARALADALKVAFAEVIAADMPPEHKGRWQQRLIAITNMSKRDVARARLQLERCNDEWNARERGKDGDVDETDR